MSPDFAQSFREEAHELLAQLETVLLDLEKRPDDQDLVGQVFRTMHTIKGSGAMFGFHEVVAFVHEIETVFDLVRNGRLAVTRSLISLTLDSRDQIRLLVGGGNNPEPPDMGKIGRQVLAFRDLAACSGAARTEGVQPPPPEAPLAPLNPQPAGTGTPAFDHPHPWRIRFRPHRDLFRDGTNPLGILKELAGLGPCRLTPHEEDVPGLEAIDPESCYLWWEIELDRSVEENAIRDAFLFVEDRAEILFLSRPDGSPATLEAQGSPQTSLKNLQGIPEPDPANSASGEAGDGRVPPGQGEPGSSRHVRVSIDHLDRLVNQISELVAVQARLSQTANSRYDTELSSIADELERLTGDLRDSALRISRVSSGKTFALAIIEGLLVRIGAQAFVLPLSAVEECIELTRQDEEKVYHKNVVMVRGTLVPYIRLREKFLVDGTPPAIQQIVIALVGRARVGFVVDQVVGEFQSVIKPLGNIYKQVQGISGATILGDGSVALILDLPRIVKEDDFSENGQEGG